VSRPELSASESGEAIFGDETQAPHIEASDAAVPLAEVPRTAVLRVAALHTAAGRTEGARATVPCTQVPCTQVPRATEPACRATPPPSRGVATSPSQPEIAPAFAPRARADAARSPA